VLRRVLELVSGQLEWDIRKLDGVGKRHCGSRFNTNRYLPIPIPTLPRCRHPILLRAAHGCRREDWTRPIVAFWESQTVVELSQISLVRPRSHVTS
jgi:hypothetical protein